MYALINTHHRSDLHAGIIISRHRTEEAAWSAAEKHARAVTRANGRGSYVPTTIEEVLSSCRAGDWLRRSDVITDD